MGIMNFSPLAVFTMIYLHTLMEEFKQLMVNN